VAHRQDLGLRARGPVEEAARGDLRDAEDLHKAIHDDFRKNPAETDLTETHLVIAEINDAIKHLAKWMKPKKVSTPMTLFGTSSEIRCEPKAWC
jgi:aldehyde dehydrogenase (NAD+)